MDDQGTNRASGGMTHRHQLVFQLPEDCPLTSLDFEDEIADALGNPLDDANKPHRVDGNSYGAGTIEFFIHTDDPQAAFELCKPLLQSAGLLDLAVVAHRKWVDGDYEEFVAIWPHNYVGKFSV
jgi:hypothetical protein